MMDDTQEQCILQALTLRAQGGDADAARILFNEKSKRVRPVCFHEVQTLEELKIEFEFYMGQSDITKAESEHATKAFDRLFKIIIARDESKKRMKNDLVRISGIILVPITSPTKWAEMAETSQRELKEFART